MIKKCYINTFLWPQLRHLVTCCCPGPILILLFLLFLLFYTLLSLNRLCILPCWHLDFSWNLAGGIEIFGDYLVAFYLLACVPTLVSSRVGARGNRELELTGTEHSALPRHVWKPQFAHEIRVLAAENGAKFNRVSCSQWALRCLFGIKPR